jgi:hypothetical protein
MAQASSSGSSSNQVSGPQKVIVIVNGDPQVYTPNPGQTAAQIAALSGVTDPALYQQFNESDFDAACYSFTQGFSLANNVVSYSLAPAKVQAVAIVKSQAATEEATATAGYSTSQLSSQASLDAIDRIANIQAVLDVVNNLAVALDENITAIESASNIETVYNTVQQPSGVISTGRGAGLGPNDLNLSYFVSLADMPGYTQADLELYVPGTDTVIPYDAALPDPYTFDSAGDCFSTNDYRLVIRYAGGGAVLSTITVPLQDPNVNVSWVYNPVIPPLRSGSSSQK